MIDGSKIRKLRKERNYTLAGLAQKANLSASYLSELERGHKEPSVKTIAKLATALNVHSSEMVHSREAAFKVGDRIRLYRREQDLTLTELAALSGLSNTYLCDIERGAVLPSVNSLKKISSILKTPVDSLIGPKNLPGEKLLALRKEHGLTQTQLAEKAGLSTGFIGQLEQGKVQPSLRTLEQISAALNVTPCYFISEEDGLSGLLRLLSPGVRALLTEPRVYTVLRALRQCSEKEFRLILDFINLIRQARLYE